MFQSRYFETFLTMIIGAIGGGCAYFIGLPVPFLMGPAILVSFAAILYKKFYIPNPLKNLCLIIIGLTMGASITPDTIGQMLNWPISVALLFPALLLIILINRIILKRFFGFDDQTAILASTPGHLSMVIALSDELGKDVKKVMLMQSMRVLFLTILVPILVVNLELDFIPVNIDPIRLSLLHSLLLILAAFGIGWVLNKMHWPAPFLIGGMIVSTGTHLTGVSVGQLEVYFIIPCFVIMGSLVGTRFMNVKFDDFKAILLPGILHCILSIGISAIFAFIVVAILNIQFAQSFIAFAPGGVEAMISMALSLDLDAAYVATHHIFRLFLLIAIVALLLHVPKTHNRDE